MEIIELDKKVLKRNDEIAEENRKALKQKGIFVFNLLSSPGSGKTSILERIIQRLKERIDIGVIVGDVQTDNDAKRIDKYKIQTVQIITNGGCHLNSKMVKNAIKKIDLNNVKVLFIENVGNLVCPANFDLGEDVRVVIMSTTEGDDKPLKYPPMFYSADVMIINKIDLLPYLSCNTDEIKNNALKINPNLKIFETSAVEGTGIEGLCDWIMEKIKE